MNSSHSHLQPSKDQGDNRADPRLRSGGEVHFHDGGRPREEEAEQDHTVPRGGQETAGRDESRHVSSLRARSHQINEWTQLVLRRF